MIEFQGSQGSNSVVGILRSPYNKVFSSSSSHRVHFEAPQSLSSFLENYDSWSQEDVVSTLRFYKDQGLPFLLLHLSDVIHLLKPQLEAFVLYVLRLPWSLENSSVIVDYSTFLIGLVSSQVYFTRPVLSSLLSFFLIEDPESGSDEIEGEGNNNEMIKYKDNSKTLISYKNTHEILKAIAKEVPLPISQEMIPTINRTFPYLLTSKSGHISAYVHNLLKASEYVKRPEIIQLLTVRLVQLDVLSPRVVDEPSIPYNNLNAMMSELFIYIKDFHDSTFESPPSFKILYFEFLKAFETHVLPTWSTTYVQFLLFYIVSLRPSLSSHFLDWLFKKFKCSKTPRIIRQSTLSYISSFGSRSLTISTPSLLSLLKKLTDWCHDYIQKFGGRSGEDHQVHGHFDACVQAVLYLFVFRHEECVGSSKRRIFIRNLNLHSIVTCSLNPLRVILPSIVQHFESLARSYQFAYCESIIARNNRNNVPLVSQYSTGSSEQPLFLDSFFPFDPMSLSEFDTFVSPFYRTYNGTGNENEDSVDDDENEYDDDDMETQ